MAQGRSVCTGAAELSRPPLSLRSRWPAMSEGAAEEAWAFSDACWVVFVCVLAFALCCDILPWLPEGPLRDHVLAKKRE